MNAFIPVYQPSLLGNEKKYVNDCLDSGWISSKGKYVEAFQTSFCQYTGIKHARAVCNGTVAIQIALAVLDIQAGDEILVPSFTYVASVSPIVERGAVPVFTSSYADTWLIDVEDAATKITPRTKAIMVPHLYGSLCDMDKIQALAKQHSLYIIEDCAESLGGLYKGLHSGSWGDISCFSFFGNKTVTTGEGGIVATNNPELAAKVNKYCNQGLSATREYWHDTLGFNYRMTNIQAAIGYAQFERINEICEAKIQLAKDYQANLKSTPLVWQAVPADVRSSYWMVSAICRSEDERNALRKYLAENQIETRPLFPPVHLMPMFTAYKPAENIVEKLAFSTKGLNLPSWPDLPAEARQHIYKTILAFYEQVK